VTEPVVADADDKQNQREAECSNTVFHVNRMI